jgi:4-hydroxy-4-methyl-2-oxoglutarate aldolase
MVAKIVEDIDRPAENVIESFRKHSAADVHEAMGKVGAMTPEISLRTAGTPMCGPATTVSLPAGDNMMIHIGARVAQPGDVLVIAADTTRAATWGELATRNAMRKRIEGVVSGGNVRDIETITDLDFPVFSRAISQDGAVKKTPGSVNVPVSVGDVVVNPGDIVIGDTDGITVVPHDAAEATAEAADEHLTKENTIRERIMDGESLYDIAEFDEQITACGLQSLSDDGE